MKIIQTILILFVLLWLTMVSYWAWGSDVQYGVVYWSGMEKPIPAKEWNNTTKVWLARSCVGEAGFDAHDECVGIAWVYATRYREIGQNGRFESVIRKYSAAVKEKSTHRRPWILTLNLAGKQPEKWPEKLSWKVHRPMWIQMLAELDAWSQGNRPNPVPTANHYGGDMDKPRKAWVRISPANGMKFRNTFYRSPF